MSLKKLQKTIENNYPRAIRLEKTKKERKESLRDFLVKFFTEWNDNKNTVYVDTREVQTDTGRRRSLGDIYMICKYYYPKITLEEVLRELLIELDNYFESGFRTSYCFNICKRVWYYTPELKSFVYNKLKHDEYGNPYRYYMAFFGNIDEDAEDEDICEQCEQSYEECECENDEYDGDGEDYYNPENDEY